MRFRSEVDTLHCPYFHLQCQVRETSAASSLRLTPMSGTAAVGSMFEAAVIVAVGESKAVMPFATELGPRTDYMRQYYCFWWTSPKPDILSPSWRGG